SRVAEASTRQNAISFRSARVARRVAISSSCSDWPSTNFTALPPPAMNWRRYSRSIRSSQVSVATAISRSGQESDAVIGPLRSLFVIDNQRLDALGCGSMRELETVSAARAKVRTSVHEQQIAGEFFARVIGARQQRQRVVNIDKRNHWARVGAVPPAPDQSPVGPPDQIEKRLFPEALRPLLRLRQEANEFARPNPALDLPADADGRLIGVDTQNEGEAIDASIPFEHGQVLLGGRHLEVGEVAAVGHVARRVEIPCAGEIAPCELGVRDSSIEPVQALGNLGDLPGLGG